MGISTFIATLLMMVLAIAAGVMIYAYTMGYLGGVTVQPQMKSMQVQSITQQTNEVMIYLKNTGQGTIVLDDPSTGVKIYINDKYWDYSTTHPFDKTNIAEGDTALVQIPIDSSYFNDGLTNKVKIVAVDGTFTESSLKVYGTSPYSLSVQISPTGGGTIARSNNGPYALNDVVVLTETISPGYTFSGWSDGTTGTSTSVTITGHNTVTATFNANQFTISTSAGTGGTIAPSGSVLVNNGANQAFTIAATTGYHIVGVTVDGSSVGAVTSYTFTAVSTGHTIAATFALDAPGTHTITASAGTGGTITPSGSVTVNNGADQLFTIAATTGYHITDVLVDGSSVGAVPTYTFTNVIADGHTISASFAVDTVQYTVTFQQSGLGSDATGIIIDLGSGNLKTYTDFPVTLTVDSGTTVSYSVSSYVPAGTGKQFSFTSKTGPDSPIIVTSDAVVALTYGTQYSLTVNDGGYGVAGGTGWYVANTNAQATMTPLTVSGGTGTQYVFAAWSVDASGTTSPSNNILMDGPKTATATWKTQYQVTFVAGTGGSITTPSSSPQWYDSGTSGNSITAAATSGYTFSSWTASPSGNVAFANYQSASTTITVTGAVTITANFAASTPVLDHFIFDTISGTKTAGTAFSITIRAIDQNGNAFTSYTGTNTLTISSGTISPTSTAAFNSGVWTGSVTLYTSGSGIAIGTTGNSKTGTSNTITVNAGSGTFGYGTIGTSYYTMSNMILGSVYTSPAYSVTPQSITAYISTSGSNRNVKAAIYTAGGTFVASTNPVSVNNYGGWITFTFPTGSKPSLTPSTQYTLVLWSDGSTRFYRLSTGSVVVKYVYATYGNWPSPGGFTSDTNEYSIYCTYSIP